MGGLGEGSRVGEHSYHLIDRYNILILGVVFFSFFSFQFDWHTGCILFLPCCVIIVFFPHRIRTCLLQLASDHVAAFFSS